MFKKIVSAVLMPAILTASVVLPASAAEISISGKTVTDGTASYKVNADGLTSGALIAASYNGDGVLYAINSQDISKNEISVDIPNEKASVKIMVWKSLSDTEPLCAAASDNPYEKEYEAIDGASTTYSSISVLWDKPEDYKDITGYNVYIDGELAKTTAANETYYTAENLDPDTEYIFTITAPTGETESEPLIEGAARTDVKGIVRDVTEYGAVGNGVTLDTAAIQSAIDACEKNDIVLIPEGKTFLTGALDLKSDMTLEVNGTLLSSKDAKDFEKAVDENDTMEYNGGITAGGARYNDEAQKRLIWSRIEGWEQYSYRSLINVGYLTEGVDYGKEEGYVCKNVKIIGSGTITGDDYRASYAPINGNATALAIDEGNSADKFYDIDATKTDNDTNYVKSRIRGRLINVSNAQNVYIKGITVAKPPMWTVHIIYSDNVVTNGVTFATSGYRNGDGWDPDSSSNCTVYNSTFSTGDDCVAIKSGKNPEGNTIARPSKNIKVIGCKSEGGLGLAVGSEMSGGVEGVYVRDCVLSNTRYGIEIKANKVRGGYVKDFHVQDSTVDQILIHSVTYNADGEAAPESPVFSDMTFENMNIIGYDSSASEKWIGTSITMNGFDGEDYYVKNIKFNDVVLGTEKNVKQNVSMTKCRNITFNNVTSFGGKPSYSANDATYTIDGELPPDPTEKTASSTVWDFAKFNDEVKTTVEGFTEDYDGLTVALDKNGADSDHDKITTAGVYWRGGASSGESSARYIEYTPSVDGVLCARGKSAKSDGAWGISTSKNVSDLKAGSNKSASETEATVYMECEAGEKYYIIPYKRAANVYEVWFTPNE